jgi:hypothetical protein
MHTDPGWLGSRAQQGTCRLPASRLRVRAASAEALLRPWGARLRSAVLISLAAFVVWLGCAVTGQVARAGGGDDHSHGPEKPVVTTAHPRVAAQSENYDLVGILKDGRLALYLHRYADNEPVPNAAITVTLGMRPSAPRRLQTGHTPSHRTASAALARSSWSSPSRPRRAMIS